MSEKIRPIRVGIIIGGDSDIPIAEKAKKILEDFEIPFAAEISSAHRTRERTEQIIKEWTDHRGCQIFIAIAGMAAHLAGVIASITLKPVIGVPVASANGQSAVNGLDALLSTVQMPSGIPVATVAINAGANAALLAIEMIAMTNDELRRRLQIYRKKMTNEIKEKSAKLNWPK